jgi:hypothetical protein
VGMRLPHSMARFDQQPFGHLLAFPFHVEITKPAVAQPAVNQHVVLTESKGSVSKVSLRHDTSARRGGCLVDGADDTC